MDIMWFSHGHHMISIWTLHGFHMDTVWCPGNHMETSTTIKQLCIKPTGFFVIFCLGAEHFVLVQVHNIISFKGIIILLNI